VKRFCPIGRVFRTSRHIYREMLTKFIAKC
jgi:hypothetical protein